MNKIKFTILFSLFLLSSCSNAVEPPAAALAQHKCKIKFVESTRCKIGNHSIELIQKPLEDDEIILQSLLVTYRDKTHELSIAPDTIMLHGDKGFIYLNDINFDGIPEPAITTSFGLANLFLDYWVFNTQSNTFNYIGNHVKFTLNQQNKSITHTIKVNAKDYKKLTYVWDRFKPKLVN